MDGGIGECCPGEVRSEEWLNIRGMRKEERETMIEEWSGSRREDGRKRGERRK